jgi:hypothetical protein
VDVADIAVAAAVWNFLEVRRPVGFNTANPALTTTATIVLSVSPSPWTAATTTFAGNHGPSTTTVFQGRVNLPAAANPPNWPAPWQPPIPFTTSFPYVRVPGGSLVIDIHQDQSPAPGVAPWYVEYSSAPLGNRIANGPVQSNCRFSVGGYNSGLGWTTAGLQGAGGIWYVSYQGGQMPGNQIGIGVIGFQGVGGSWGGVPLPVDLGPLGAPGCAWNISWALSAPLMPTSVGARWPDQTIPNDPALRGTSFYDQALFLDAAANALGLVMSQSSRWLIAPGVGAFVQATGANAGSPNGTLATATPTFQLR